ncbi:hypothetical protein [Novosphingobium resinovorum]|uniref:hypothetical protein n=2 Tax=Sphingomonadaceae TaxID=41297 RepID=UPI0022F2487D|nr:hypothetical protein [Novosphingobium resinovorum]
MFTPSQPFGFFGQMRLWLASYNVELPLLDIINDPVSDDVTIELAARSLGVGLDSGYYDAEALADCLSQIWSEIEDGILDDESEARIELAGVIGGGGRYVRGLYDTVRHLDAQSAANYLAAHVGVMMARVDMARFAREIVAATAA